MDLQGKFRAFKLEEIRLNLSVVGADMEFETVDFEATARAVLADGGETISRTMAVLWEGRTRYVEADAADTTPFVGMQLLDGPTLYIEVEDGGAS